MRLVADECVDYGIIRELRKNNVEVFSIFEEIASIKDKNVLEIANEREWILLTEDRDFGELVFRLKNAHHGVILIRLEGYKPHLKAGIVLSTITKHSNELINSFTVIQPNATRIRK